MTHINKYKCKKIYPYKIDDIYYMIMENDTDGLNNVSLSKLNSKFNGSTYLNEAIEIGNPKIIKLQF